MSVSALFLAGMGLLLHGAGTPAGAEGLGRPITFHAGWLLVAAVTVGSALPMAAVLIRRLHDANRSGWYALLFLIPSLGFLILFYFVMLPGDAGVNRYGAPYQRR